MAIHFPKPVLGFAGYSGAGKTTLLKEIIDLFQQRDIRAGLIKHAHHNFDVDIPGKDSYELRKAGASPVIVASSKRWVKMVDLPEPKEPDLQELIGALNPEQVDIVIVEGFKKEPFCKIEVHRSETEKPFLHPEDSNIVAIVTDVDNNFPIPRLDINQPVEVTEFIIEKCRLG
jgi:molybdopterin-guanine dinucleotide biosynthesis protein MobB